MTYQFQYKTKNSFFWKKKNVVGHGFEKYQNGVLNYDKMVLFFEDGSIEVIPDWKNCSLILGTDWVLFTQRQMEKESGQEIKLNVKSRS